MTGRHFTPSRGILPPPVATMDGVQLSLQRNPVLKDVSFSVRPGEFTWLEGPSGSGKTTILRTLTGLERPTAGSATLLGQDVHALGNRQRRRLFARHVGIGYQTPTLIGNESIANNMRIVAEATGVYDHTTDKRIAHILGLLGLGQKLLSAAETPVACFSGGEQQRISIGRLLVTDPEILILDEPTSALDTEASRNLFRMLRNVVDDSRKSAQSPLSILMSSHDRPTLGDINHGPLLVDHVISMDSGCIREDISVSQA